MNPRFESLYDRLFDGDYWPEEPIADWMEDKNLSPVIIKGLIDAPLGQFPYFPQPVVDFVRYAEIRIEHIRYSSVFNPLIKFIPF